MMINFSLTQGAFSRPTVLLPKVGFQHLKIIRSSANSVIWLDVIPVQWIAWPSQLFKVMKSRATLFYNATTLLLLVLMALFSYIYWFSKIYQLMFWAFSINQVLAQDSIILLIPLSLLSPDESRITTILKTILCFHMNWIVEVLTLG